MGRSRRSFKWVVSGSRTAGSANNSLGIGWKRSQRLLNFRSTAGFQLSPHGVAMSYRIVFAVALLGGLAPTIAGAIVEEHDARGGRVNNLKVLSDKVDDVTT